MKPQILFLDIETAPDLVYVWGVYQQNAIEVSEDWYLLSAAWQWRGERLECAGLDDFSGYKPGSRDDRRLAKRVHGLLDQADIVVAHNGVDFDLKKLNARFIAHGFDPPSPYKTVDTKRALKQVAAFSSNRLDWLSRQLDLGRKLEHQGFALWKGCMRGDPACWKKMKSYNRHDIRLLVGLYERISAYIKQPNRALYSGDERCVNPACGSTEIEWRGLSRQITRTYRRFVCRVCGRWGRAVLSERTPRAVVTS